jgi:hypothetical protein
MGDRRRPTLRGLLWELALIAALVAGFYILLSSSAFAVFGEWMAGVFRQSLSQ